MTKFMQIAFLALVGIVSFIAGEAWAQDPFGAGTGKPQATGQPNDPFNPPGPPGGPGPTPSATGTTTTTTTTTRRNPPPPPPPPPKGEECPLGLAKIFDQELGEDRCPTFKEAFAAERKKVTDEEDNTMLYLILMGIFLSIVMIWEHLWTRGKLAEMARVFLERLRGLSDDEDEDDSS